MPAPSPVDGGVVFAAAMSHAPHILAFPEAAPDPMRKAFYAAARDMGTRLHATRPDALAIVSSDHFSNFGHEAMPAFAVGTAPTYRGPVEDWLGVEEFEIAGAAAAEAMASSLIGQSFDVTVCAHLRLEHGMVVPLQLVDPDARLPVVPIVQNCAVPPLPGLGRCYAFGQALHAAAESAGIRLAVIGAGGLSHAPGAETSGIINEAFDHAFLERLRQGLGDADPGGVLTNAEVDAAGFGAWEVRQWFTAWGARGGLAAETLTYQPVREWETGCAVAVFGP